MALGEPVFAAQCRDIVVLSRVQYVGSYSAASARQGGGTDGSVSGLAVPLQLQQFLI
jgi:hypothetical protein